jgi:ABC-type transport system substrate-binding protein
MAIAAWIACLATDFAAPAARAADMSKTLRTAFIVAETGFDPAASSDIYSDAVQRSIFDTLYAFDYLARPYRRTMRTAAAMPEVTDEGRTWTMRVKPGIYFADDPAFKGRKRELVAQDFI